MTLWGGGSDTSSFTLNAEQRLIAVAIVAGALGAFVHTASSFADHVGNRKFRSHWVWWYPLRPFIGSAMALTFCFVVRAGLLATGFSPGTSTTGQRQGSAVFMVAAFSALAGMFSKQAADKLSEVFDTLFKSDKDLERDDELTPSAPSTDTPKDQ